MEEKTRMVHVMMPLELIREIEFFLKKHKGTKTGFIVNAVAERLRQEKARQNFKKLRGSLAYLIDTRVFIDYLTERLPETTSKWLEETEKLPVPFFPTLPLIMRPKAQYPHTLPLFIN